MCQGMVTVEVKVLICMSVFIIPSSSITDRRECGGDRSNVKYDAVYVGETERSLKIRFSEHRRPSSTT